MHTVLVVDDALTIRKYHRNLLEEVGYQVLEAENGIEALEKMFEYQVHLCLVDVNMPLMDGFTFVNELRKGEHHPDCPVIMITTEASESESNRGYEAGANLYLIKPTSPETLQTYCQIMLSAIEPDVAANTSESHLAFAGAAAGSAEHGLHSYMNALLSE